MMGCPVCGADNEPPAPDERDLEDMLAALLTGDLALARIFAARVFVDDPSRAICERMLASRLARRAA